MNTTRSTLAIEAVMGPYPERVARVRKVIDEAPPHAQDWAEAVVLDLAKAGISSEDMLFAFTAVDRIVRADGGEVDPRTAAEFVATAAAIGGISGQNLLLIGSSLAHAARKVWQP